MTDSCIFCAVAAHRAEAMLVYEDEHACAFLDRSPALDGHTLVVPKQHVADLMSPDAASALVHIAPAMAAASRILLQALNADGISVFQSNRPAAGQEVMHLHFHLVPRHSGDAALTRWRPNPAARQRLAAVHAAILRAGQSGRGRPKKST
ncbi:MAG TPA: HIT family protein [Mycobacteriales bacterium]|nr:HIT family protein [Mycobacteriales bacterium]